MKMQDVLNVMEKSYNLYYVDYNDSFDDNTSRLNDIIKGSDEAFDILNDLVFDNYDTYIIIRDIKNELKQNLLNNNFDENDIEDFFEENELEINDEIFNRDNSTPIRDLLKNTNDLTLRVYWNSNYDCINSFYYESQSGLYYSDYLKQVMQLLKINPKEFKDKMIKKGYSYSIQGKFPNIKYKTQYVDIDCFIEEFENLVCGASLLTFVAKLNPIDVLKGKINKLVIPKGNTIGFFSSDNGGGSMFECPLINDFEINLNKIYWKSKYNKFNLCLDKSDKYNIDNTYGVTNDFWGERVIIK